MQRPEPYLTGPLAGVDLPLETSGVSISVEEPGKTFLITPFRGAEESLNQLLQAHFGVSLPGTLGGGASEHYQLLWFGMGAFILVGPPNAEPDWLDELRKHAALNEVSDAWPCIAASGDRVEALLQLKIPVDLEPLQEGTAFFSLLDDIQVHIYKADKCYFLRSERSLFECVILRLQEMIGLVEAVEKLNFGERH